MLANVIIVVLLALVIGFIVYRAIKNRGKGGCSGCSGCSAQNFCSGDPADTTHK